MFEIEMDFREFDKIKNILNEKTFNKAVVRTLNRVANAGFTAGSKKIREEYNIKARDIKKASKIRKATFNDQRVILTISGGSIPFKYFGAKQTKKGVTVKIKRYGPRILVKHAFIGGYIPKRKGRSYKMVKVSNWGGGHVYIRKGKARLPIVKLAATSVTIPKLFASDKVIAAIESRVGEIAGEEFVRNLKFYAKV